MTHYLLSVHGPAERNEFGEYGFEPYAPLADVQNGVPREVVNGTRLRPLHAQGQVLEHCQTLQRLQIGYAPCLTPRRRDRIGEG